MRTKGSLLVKEIIGHNEESLQLASTFSAPFPIKEVYKVRHTVSAVNTVIGKKGIAYFGSIVLKVYCISDNDLGIHLVEDLIRFRGFALFECPPEDEPVDIDVRTTVQDVFVEDINAKCLKVFALLLVNITFTRDKELNADDISLCTTKEQDFGNTVCSSNQYRIDIEDPESDTELIIHNLQVE